MTSNKDSQIESRASLRSGRRQQANSQPAIRLSRNKAGFSPGRILVATIAGIALAEVIAMLVVYFFRQLPYPQQVLLDAAVMTAIVFPILYFLSFKPLLLQIQQQQQSESVTQARLRLMEYSNGHNLDELLQFIVDESEMLTGSTIGFFHFLEEDQTTLWLQAWSSNTLSNMCKAEGKDSHYDVEQAGVWADAVRSRQPIIHNDYATLPQRKGMPEGHATVVREMVIPILRDNKVVAILGTGNKEQDYTARDVEIVTTFADFAWDIVEHVRAENALRQSEEKFRTLADWTYDWEKWLNPDGNIVYTSPSCERITGYSPQEFIADPNLLIRIVHPDDRQSFAEHQRIVHDQSAGLVMTEYRINARDGSEHWIEHICRPLFSPDNLYLGRRVSNRDITARKQAETKIIEQSRKEVILTQAVQTIQTDIARDLHDTLGQNIGYLRMNLENLSAGQERDLSDIKIQIQTMAKAANEAYELIRAMLVILQTDNLTDPQSLFSRYAGQVAERSTFQIYITSQGQPEQQSPHQIRQLFYIFREALSNIEKYAAASRVSCEFIWLPGALRLVISDNGCGFDAVVGQARGHYGLIFMRERVAQLQGSIDIQSAPDQGTTITVYVPYESGDSYRSSQDFVP